MKPEKFNDFKFDYLKEDEPKKKPMLSPIRVSNSYGGMIYKNEKGKDVFVSDSMLENQKKNYFETLEMIEIEDSRTKKTNENENLILKRNETSSNLNDSSSVNSIDLNEYNNNLRKICRWCKKKGHVERKCPFKVNSCSFCLGKHNRDDCSQKYGCSKCLKGGHNEIRCPRKKAVGCFRCRKLHTQSNCRFLVLNNQQKESENDKKLTGCFVCGSNSHFSCLSHSIKEDDIFGDHYQKNFPVPIGEVFFDKYFDFVKRYEQDLKFNSLKLKQQDNFGRKLFNEKQEKWNRVKNKEKIESLRYNQRFDHVNENRSCFSLPKMSKRKLKKNGCSKEKQKKIKKSRK